MFHLETRTSTKKPWLRLSSSPETREGRESLHKHRRYWIHFNGHSVQTRIVSDFQLYEEKIPPRPASALFTAAALIFVGWALVVFLAVVR